MRIILEISFLWLSFSICDFLHMALTDILEYFSSISSNKLTFIQYKIASLEKIILFITISMVYFMNNNLNFLYEFITHYAQTYI
jgi:hypothetical protein